MSHQRTGVSIWLCVSFLTILILQEGYALYFDRSTSLWVSFRTAQADRAIIDSGLRFYTPDQIATLRVDDAFLLQLIRRFEQKRDHRMANATLVQNDITSYAPDPFARLMNPEEKLSPLVFHRRALPFEQLPSINNNSYLIDPPYDAYLRDPWDDILFKVLACDTHGYDDGDFAILTSSRSNRGDYSDTHVLLGLLLLRGNHCYDTQKIEAEIPKAVSALIVGATQDSVFSDLYAERIVLLYWAGVGNVVKREWIEKIQSNLTTDPGWRSGADTFSNAHTTGLALLALLYFQDGQPHQPFYEVR